MRLHYCHQSSFSAYSNRGFAVSWPLRVLDVLAVLLSPHVPVRFVFTTVIKHHNRNWHLRCHSLMWLPCLPYYLVFNCSKPFQPQAVPLGFGTCVGKRACMSWPLNLHVSFSLTPGSSLITVFYMCCASSRQRDSAVRGKHASWPGKKMPLHWRARSV